jgi:hypothetical protein
MPRFESRLARPVLAATLLMLAACGGEPGTADSDEPVTLFDAYSEALINPQGFDTYIRDHNLRTPEFHACIVAARDRLAAQWTQIMAACDTDPEVTDRAGCKANDYATASSVINGMEVAIRTDTAFAMTGGGTAVQMKRETLGPAQWEQNSNGWLPVLRSTLVCEMSTGA